MAKRRLSHHQKKRIDSAQQALTESSDHLQGLVISHHGGKVVVELPENINAKCSVKSNLGTIVCGDQVVCEQTANGAFRVLAIQQRQNLLQRVDGFGQIKAVAANITQLLICLAVKPEPNLFLLDQYLLAAEQQAIEPVIILNKIDLLEDRVDDPFELESIYAALGYQVAKISTKQKNGLEALRSIFDHNTSVLSGVSGVGKSSITGALLPEISIKVAEISEANEEGRHTTRTSRLYHLPNEGQLIDTPGVRGFNPVIDTTQPISAGFREIAEHADHCRFANCKHINEPKCTVLEAVKKGAINEGRYQHYLRMLQT